MIATPTLIMDRFPDFSTPGFDIDQYNQRFYNSNVVIHASAKSVHYPTHWTPLSLKCVLNGEEHYKTNNARYLVDVDHFLVFNNGRMYSSWIDSPVEVNSFTLNVAPAFERMAIRSIQASATQLLDDPFSHDVEEFRFTERLYRHSNQVANIVKRIDFYAIMEYLLHLEKSTRIEIGKIDTVKGSTRKEIFERLRRARDYIHSCYQSKLTIEIIAGIACMNSFYFLRQFRKVFRITPHQFLTQRRMEVSMRLLKTTDKPIADICFEVGFVDPSSFSKLFRSYYGFPPSALRM